MKPMQSHLPFLTMLFFMALFLANCKEDNDSSKKPEVNGPTKAATIDMTTGWMTIDPDLDSTGRVTLLEELQQEGEGDTFRVSFLLDSLQSLITTRLVYDPIHWLMDSIPPTRRAYLYINADCNKVFPAVNNECIGLPQDAINFGIKAVQLNINAYTRCGNGKGLCIEMERSIGTKSYFRDFGCPGNPVYIVPMSELTCQ